MWNSHQQHYSQQQQPHPEQSKGFHNPMMNASASSQLHSPLSPWPFVPQQYPPVDAWGGSMPTTAATQQHLQQYMHAPSHPQAGGMMPQYSYQPDYRHSVQMYQTTQAPAPVLHPQPAAAPAPPPTCPSESQTLVSVSRENDQKEDPKLSKKLKSGFQIKLGEG